MSSCVIPIGAHDVEPTQEVKVVERFVLLQLGSSAIKLDTQTGNSWILKTIPDTDKQEWVIINDNRPSHEFLGQRA
jgi:hypothetical protein